MDYNALANANVDLFQYLSALRTSLSLNAASFSSVIDAKLSTGAALNALASTLSGQGQNQAANAAARLAGAAGSGSPVDLSQLFDLGPYAGQDHVTPGSGASVSLTALELADAVIVAAQGGREVQLDLSAAAPTLAGLTAYLAIGQRASGSPWIAIDDAGTVIVHTAQARLYLDAKAAPASNLLNPLGVSVIDIPLYVELAQAEAKLGALTCGASPSDESVHLLAAPSLGELALGSVGLAALTDFTTPEMVSPARLVSLGPIQATGTSLITIGGNDWQAVSFSSSDITNGVVKSVATTNAASATLSSLLANAQIGVGVSGLGLVIGAGPASSALQATLTGAGPALDQALNALTAMLGLQLGVAEVKVNGVRCKGAALVA